MKQWRYYLLLIVQLQSIAKLKACFVGQGQAKIASLFWCLNSHFQFCFPLLVCVTVAEENPRKSTESMDWCLTFQHCWF